MWANEATPMASKLMCSRISGSTHDNSSGTDRVSAKPVLQPDARQFALQLHLHICKTAPTLSWREPTSSWECVEFRFFTEQTVAIFWTRPQSSSAHVNLSLVVRRAWIQAREKKNRACYKAQWKKKPWAEMSPSRSHAYADTDVSETIMAKLLQTTPTPCLRPSSRSWQCFCNVFLC
ncbi:hypothetical protein BGZ63DRAFT_161353 [Mariannaea sp. PMI_226]|nr:hypothetical protein BGZ63DRAFT_161353 [Mariannaea sp. PMI_226]